MKFVILIILKVWLDKIFVYPRFVLILIKAIIKNILIVCNIWWKGSLPFAMEKRIERVFLDIMVT